MAIAEITSSGQRNSANNAVVTVAMSPAPTAGNLIVAMAGWADDTKTPSTPTDSLGTTYTLICDTGDIPAVTGYARSAMWWGIAPSSGANTITFTISGTAYHMGAVTEFSGAHASAPYDVSIYNTATSGGTSAMSSGTTASTAGTGEMLYAFGFSSGGAFSAPSTPSGYTASWSGGGLSGLMDVKGAYLLNQGVGTYSASMTAGAVGWWTMILAAFKPAGGGSTSGDGAAIIMIL